MLFNFFFLDYIFSLLILKDLNDNQLKKRIL